MAQTRCAEVLGSRGCDHFGFGGHDAAHRHRARYLKLVSLPKRHQYVGEVYDLGGSGAKQEIAYRRQGARSITERDLPSDDDGRLAPHEWNVIADGVLKLDAAGHHRDYSTNGVQPIWWDVAGTAIEWKFEQAARTSLQHP